MQASSDVSNAAVWLIPAIAFTRFKGQTASYQQVLRFFKALEQRTLYVFMCGADRGTWFQCWNELLSEIEQGRIEHALSSSPGQVQSALHLSQEERGKLAQTIMNVSVNNKVRSTAKCTVLRV